jgi:hypothetical protein
MRLVYRLIVLVMVLGGMGLVVIDRARQAEQPGFELTPAEQERRAIAAAKSLEDRARRNLAEHPDGRHCLDPRTGTHPGVIAFTRAKLHEPASFEHVATEIAPVNINGLHLLRLQYRARNQAGGTYDMSEQFVVQNSDCSFER